MLPALGLSWAKLRRQTSHTAQVALLSPTCIQMCPGCALLDPSSQVRRQLRPSWAQVGSCSAQLKAKDGQVALLSSLSYSLRAVLAARRWEYVDPMNQAFVDLRLRLGEVAIFSPPKVCSAPLPRAAGWLRKVVETARNISGKKVWNSTTRRILAAKI